ncbi:MAG: dockerin type I domain-containing protein, partial [Eubacterium sp.]|nr:dockerin type I domain-containing protein [Eubacterium sp.]
ALPKTLIYLIIVNPDCQIDEEYHMWNITTDDCLIIAPPYSSIREFASKYGFASINLPGSLCDPVLMGDVNNNGEIDIADLAMLEKYLLGKGELDEWKLADLCEDGVIDSFDLALMRKTLINTVGYERPQPDDTTVNLSERFEAQSTEGAKADEEFIMAQTKFALDLMQKSVSEDTNTLISPYSVMQALSMTANGADGETLAEMEKALGGISIDKLNEYLYTQRTSQPNDENCKLSTANSIWFRDDSERINVLPEFLQKNKTYYDADSFKAPFDESTVNDINNWVNEKTYEMIPKIINDIDPDVVSFIINAVAFDAKWMKQYEENQISSGNFTAYDGTVQEAEMLNSIESLYLEDDNAVGIYKYYAGKKYAFAALLPDEGISVSDYIAGLTPESLNKILSSPKYVNIECSLPKFSYDYENELSDDLQLMGMKQAFKSGSADFSRMSEISPYISKILHKTHIELTESGTKAAAVTAVELSNDCILIPDKSVAFDRPFVYCIVDTETSIPVFIGTLTTIPEE